MPSTTQHNARMDTVRKQGKRNWLDIATTLWAITLVVVAVTWIAGPVVAGGGGPCSIGLCIDEDLCADEGGCKNAEYEGGQCGGDCRLGGEWSCPMEDV